MNEGHYFFSDGSPATYEELLDCEEYEMNLEWEEAGMSEEWAESFEEEEND